ncbi:MAG: hypothetical protein HYX89_04635 [Chloroflexi bacterium]|nr:hypothetical protein [Chloroflexota bacterium]
MGLTMGLTRDQMNEAAAALNSVRSVAVRIAREKFKAHKAPVRGAVICAVADADSVIFLWLSEVGEQELTIAFDSLATSVSKDLEQPSSEVLEKAIENAKADVDKKEQNGEQKNKIRKYLDKLNDHFKDTFSSPNRQG